MNQPRYRPAPHVLYRPVAGHGGVLLDLDGRNYLELDPVAARIWELAAEGETEPAIVGRLLEEFAADRPTIESDVARVLGDLAAAGAIEATST